MSKDNPQQSRLAEYAFGDDDTSSRSTCGGQSRFRSSYRSLLEAVNLPPIVDLAVDIGCGPGYTTGLLRTAVNPRSLAGIDISPSFIARARANPCGSTAWFIRDVTNVPFPTGPADLLQARWVLAHLQDPQTVLASWLTQLRPGGTLLIQEDDSISSDTPLLSTYQRISDSLVAHRGGDLYAGRLLGQTAIPPQYELTLNRIYDHDVPAPTAAGIYGMNLAVWRTDQWIQSQHSPDALNELAHNLSGIAHSYTPGKITFSIRQIAITHTPRPH